MGKFIDLTGQRFGRLVVIDKEDRGWKCLCDCGNYFHGHSNRLLSGHEKSCGCAFASREENLVGKQYGMFTVIAFVGKDVHGSRLWEVQCKCGNRKIYTTTQMKLRESCGCLKSQQISERFIKDLTGKIFGRLTVINQVPKRKNGRVLWNCKCECGENIIVEGHRLLNGTKTDCGCMYKTKMAQTRKRNVYKIMQDISIGYASNTNTSFYFDTSDYNKIKDYTWQESPTHYIYSIEEEKRSRKRIDLHRLVMNPKQNEEIDHIDRNPLNNCKNNLRIATSSQNKMNQSRRKDNTSGVTGVGVYKNNLWRARIHANGKEINLGVYKSFEDAVVARLKAEKIYYKEFAPQKALFNKYNIGDI